MIEWMSGSISLCLHTYRWATKNRSDRGRRSKACQGLDVRLLGQQASALGVAGEGQGAQTLQVQMALPAGWLKEVLAGNHLKERYEDGDWSCGGGVVFVLVGPLGLPVERVRVESLQAKSAASLCSSEVDPEAKCCLLPPRLPLLPPRSFHSR